VKRKIISYPLHKRYETFYRPSQQSDNYELITITFSKRLYGQWGPSPKRSVCRGRSGLTWCSYRFPIVPDVEVDDTREGSCKHCFVLCLCLTAKSSHVGVNMDVLACPYTSPWWLEAVRRGDETSCQVSCYPVVQQAVASLWRMQSPWTRIFVGVFVTSHP
jgi:hypothetical protein